jgi:hypothetical protein
MNDVPWDWMTAWGETQSGVYLSVSNWGSIVWEQLGLSLGYYVHITHMVHSFTLRQEWRAALSVHFVFRTDRLYTKHTAWVTVFCMSTVCSNVDQCAYMSMTNKVASTVALIFMFCQTLTIHPTPWPFVWWWNAVKPLTGHEWRHLKELVWRRLWSCP